MRRLLPLLLLAACKGVEAPAPAGPDAAVLLAEVRVTGLHARPQSSYPRRILFARLAEGSDDPCAAAETVWSNYARGSRVYLFNATPGRWVLACAVSFVEGKDHYVFLPAGVVEASVAEVTPGSVVSLGTVRVSESRAWSKADEVQRHFHDRVLAQRPEANVWQQIFPSMIDFRGEYGRHRPDDGSAAARARKAIGRWGWDR